MRRADKLVLFAALVFAGVTAVAAAFGPPELRWERLGRALPFAAFAVLHPVMLWLGPGKALGLSCVPLAVCAWAATRDASPVRGGDWKTALDDAGVMALVAVALLFTVVAVFCLDAVRHEHRPLRGLGALGLLLVGAYLVLSPFTALLHRTAPATFFLLAVSLLLVVARWLEREHYSVAVRRKKTLGVIVIAKDEADRIARCLESVQGWADEIVVLDSGSTDGTVEIAGRYTAAVHVTDWPGYGPQKQRALQLARSDWVLSIDADEEVTPELRHDIDRVLSGEPACVGYHVPWGVIVYGKLLDFGRSARAPLRLFVREGSRFTDAQVHETVVLPPGRVGRLRGRLLHYTQRDFGHALEKVARYGWLGAKQRHERGKRGGGLPGAVVRALIVFVQVWVIRLGFLDGGPGFLVAALYAQVAFDKYAGLWALRREAAQAQRQR